MRLSDPIIVVQETIKRVGKDLRIATPLGIGKPNHLLNAFYQAAKNDPSITLSIFTALSFELPKGKSDLEKRFLEPTVNRVFGNYPDLKYEVDRQNKRVPENIKIYEFYFLAGKHSHLEDSQQNYISSNYTHVSRDLFARGTNVVLQMVSRGLEDNQEKFSLSSNPDVTLDLMRNLFREEKRGRKIAFIAQINEELPFMYGDSVVDPTTFHFVIEAPNLNHRLFGPPKMSVADADYIIGFYASTLIKDGGELQIGIGSLGDALTYALLMRHKDPQSYEHFLQRLRILERFGDIVEHIGSRGPFKQGLFAATEMFVDGFLHLLKNGILKRRVYDDITLQRLLNEGKITEDVSAQTVLALLSRKRISPTLDKEDVSYLKLWGIFNDQVDFVDEKLSHRQLGSIIPNLLDDTARKWIFQNALGNKLKNGHIVHGGFFAGPPSFYQALRDMSVEERKLISMRSVLKINQLYGHEELDTLHRINARFVNTCMMVTLLGAVVSDALDDGRVVSGVGGQYNFVTMAHALPDGRSIIQLRSTSERNGQLKSNIVWNYGHTTIPRHLRDIVITEYGIADLRSKTDSEVIDQLLRICDSRFQDELMQKAKDCGKLPKDYQIPELYRHNLPNQYKSVLSEARGNSQFPPFPFGTDLTPDEIELGRALKVLKKKVQKKSELVKLLFKGFWGGKPSEKEVRFLLRMGLDSPKNFKEKLYAKMLTAVFR